jgi:hypothetical protein
VFISSTLDITVLRLLRRLDFCVRLQVKRTWLGLIDRASPYLRTPAPGLVRVRVTLRLAVYRQSVLLSDNPLRLTASNFIFQLNTCSYSPYVTSSLTRGWVCRLQLLLIHASAVLLRVESRGTQDHILFSQIRDSPNLEDQVPVFISPRNSVARLYPQARGSIFVASYDSQSYEGGIQPCLHTVPGHQHEIGYITQAQHKSSARVKTNIKRNSTHVA